MLTIVISAIVALAAASILYNLSLLDQLDTERKRATQFQEHSKLHFRRKLAAEAQLFCALKELEQIPPESRYTAFGRRPIGLA